MDKLPIAGIIPAAGTSRRMGQDKRLLSIGSMTILERSTSSLIEAGCDPVVVVLEPNSPCVKLPLFRLTTLSSLQVIILDRASPSMLNTICKGVDYLPETVLAFAILPGDCPFIAPSLIRSLAEKVAHEHPLLLIPMYQGNQGHPRFVSREMFGKLKNLPKSEKFSSIFNRHEDNVVYIETGHVSIMYDIDTQEEFKIFSNAGYADQGD